MTDEARIRMSDWRFWMGIAYFLLVFALVAVLVDYNQATTALSKSQQLVVEHEIELSAAHRARVTQCIDNIPLNREVREFIIGVREFHTAVAANNKALLDATPRSSPLYRLRLRNYERIAITIPEVSAVHFPVLTAKQCRALK